MPDFDRHDIVYVPYNADIPAGFYEVLHTEPLWLRNDGDASYCGECNDFGNVRLVCKFENREDMKVID